MTCNCAECRELRAKVRLYDAAEAARVRIRFERGHAVVSPTGERMRRYDANSTPVRVRWATVLS